jgi:hypothetical protein
MACSPPARAEIETEAGFSDSFSNTSFLRGQIRDRDTHYMLLDQDECHFTADSGTP